jgi:glyoxylase-like metal-dependent hydrolase (beta-lactamase superfamily II)
MIIKQLELGPMGNFIYLLEDEAAKICAVIDPGWEAEKIVKIAEKDGFKITHILLTHTHFDHAAVANTLSQKTGATIFVQNAFTLPDTPLVRRVLWLMA